MLRYFWFSVQWNFCWNFVSKIFRTRESKTCSSYNEELINFFEFWRSNIIKVDGKIKRSVELPEPLFRFQPMSSLICFLVFKWWIHLWI
jgi:hypothetical protein